MPSVPTDEVWEIPTPSRSLRIVLTSVPIDEVAQNMPPCSPCSGAGQSPQRWTYCSDRPLASTGRPLAVRVAEWPGWAFAHRETCSIWNTCRSVLPSGGWSRGRRKVRQMTHPQASDVVWSLTTPEPHYSEAQPSASSLMLLDVVRGCFVGFITWERPEALSTAGALGSRRWGTPHPSGAKPCAHTHVKAPRPA